MIVEPDPSAVLAWADAHAEKLATADHLPDELVELSLAGGLYRMYLVPELGGLGTPLTTTSTVIEQLSYVDGSLGWCTTVANGAAGLLAGLPEPDARLVAADPEHLSIAGGFAPVGRTVLDGTDRLLTGRWGFASGCTSATWFLGGAMLDEGPRVGFFPVADGHVVDDWDVIGLRATGSHTVTATDVRIPATSWTELFDRSRPSWSTDPTARIPFGANGLLAIVPLGIARRALDELAELALTRKPFGQQQRLADDPAFQLPFGIALARLESAHRYLLDMQHAVWTEAEDGAVAPATEARVNLASGHAADTAVEVVQFAHKAAGTTAIRGDTVLTRCLHDAMVATRHVAFGQPMRARAAQPLLSGRASLPG
ncbi:acyl-CoA dehydrogenase family protein [Pseudonocardia sp. TRM90224]|uniref:acyl-CoA dehydrogenase family protein n=1 Tax=Pseudonocardia sp. TRM90224 TaxID=2812678 RepID=UPI001E2E3F60|nr:acyl-CoA dehydrogenase family protein [Pseudonocardia sp. TRM90224]